MTERDRLRDSSSRSRRTEFDFWTDIEWRVRLVWGAMEGVKVFLGETERERGRTVAFSFWGAGGGKIILVFFIFNFVI